LEIVYERVLFFETFLKNYKLLNNSLNFKNKFISTMKELNISTPDKGLSLGINAPMINVDDIDGENVNLLKLLEKYRGVLIDLFRGSW